MLGDDGTVPVDQLDSAGWLVEAITMFTGRVAELVPPGFDSYLRLFHRPDQGLPRPGAASTWAEVAARHGTVMHPEAQWTALTDGRPDSPHRLGPQARSDQAITGTLDPLSLSALSALLARHTQTPQECHYALWEGTGKSPRSWDAHPRFHLPMRSYWLFAPVPVDEIPVCSVELEVAGIDEATRQPGGMQGRVAFAGQNRSADNVDVVRRVREAGFVQSPSWWWPADRAWVVHSEIDYDTTLIAGSRALRDALMRNNDLECLEVEPTTSLMANADRINAPDF